MIIEVNHVTKEFELGQLRSLKDSVLALVSRLRGHPVEERSRFKALDDVDIKVEQGEVVGIIGQNGAGKSTLLKLLAGISTPTRGTIAIRGRVAPLIEVGAGLVPDLTGRENIYLNGCLLGMSRVEVARKFDDIVAFAELDEFIDTPIKRYSSGMQVRLGFAIATTIEAEILIVDEVLAVGDLAFQRKCFDRMEGMIKGRGATVLLVSHNIRQVERLCTRVIMLDHGRICHEGSASDVCARFYEHNDESIRKGMTARRRTRMMSGELDLTEAFFLDARGRRVDQLTYRGDFSVCFRVKVLSDIKDLSFGFGIHTTDFLYLTTHNSGAQLSLPHLPIGEHEVVCKVSRLPLLPGAYSLRFGVAAGPRDVFYAENLNHFQVVQRAVGDVPSTIRQGFLALDAQWCVDRQAEGAPVAEEGRAAS